MAASKIHQSNVTILVCGDRNYNDVETITSVLTMCQQKYGSITIIHGACSGADTISGAYATCNKIPCKSFPAQWKQYGRGAGTSVSDGEPCRISNPAGPIRNKQMIEEGFPSLVLAFHPDIKSSKGTKDMVSQAMKKNIPVMLVSSKSDSIQVLSMDMLT
jgi:YspA, cpYpsA-related SLOG family